MPSPSFRGFGCDQDASTDSHNGRSNTLFHHVIEVRSGDAVFSAKTADTSRRYSKSCHRPAFHKCDQDDCAFTFCAEKFLSWRVSAQFCVWFFFAQRPVYGGDEAPGPRLEAILQSVPSADRHWSQCSVRPRLPILLQSAPALPGSLETNQDRREIGALSNRAPCRS